MFSTAFPYILAVSMNALGLDKETLFNNHCMGELLKGRITSTALPISKEINGEKKDLGEACFMCVKGADGKVATGNYDYYTPAQAMPRIISSGSTKANIEAIKKYFCSEYAV